MFHLAQAPRRAPFSDWKAQVERRIERQTGKPVTIADDCGCLLACYNVGLEPDEVAADFIEGN